MKVLQILTHLNIGGIPTYAYTLTKYLLRQNIEVAVASSGGKWEEEFKKLGVEVFRINVRTKNEFSYKLPLALYQLFKIKKKFNFEIIHSHTRVTQVLSEIFSILSDAAHVGNFHGFYAQNKLRLGRKIFKAHGNRSIAITPQVKHDLIYDFCAQESKVRLILSGIDLEPLDQASLNFKLDGSPKIGASGRLSSVKGFKYLIESIPQLIKRYPDIHLYILGQGKQGQELIELADSLNIRKNFTILKNIDLADFLNTLDIFCLPSLQEPLGLSVIEAQYLGIPCVVTDIGGLRILVKNLHTGLIVPPKDSKAISEAITTLLEDKILSRKISDSSKHQAKEKFDISKKINQFIRVYHEAINEISNI